MLTGRRSDDISVNLVTNLLMHSIVYRSYWTMLVMEYSAATFLRFSEWRSALISEKGVWTVGSGLPVAMYDITWLVMYEKDISNVLLH